MDIGQVRDVAIIVASIALAIVAIESIVLFRKASRVLDIHRRTMENVEEAVGTIKESLKGISVVAGIIAGIKKAIESFSKKETEEERRE